MNRVVWREGFNTCRILHCSRNLIVRHISSDLPSPNHEAPNGAKGACCEGSKGLPEGHGVGI